MYRSIHLQYEIQGRVKNNQFFKTQKLILICVLSFSKAKQKLKQVGVLQ